ncbi:MAG: hypothetical protein Q8K30_05575 [Candidatus Gracilibacteria bacterium]|nr:hypothetical protein [Candidatus Gracilibacteria bacterium]
MEEINNNLVNNLDEKLSTKQNVSNSKYYDDKINIDHKVIGNAISAYLMIFISWLFLFNKTNKNINNYYVIGHTKSASTIHLGFLITYIVFISNSFLGKLGIFGIGLNIIIADIIFIGLLIALIMGIYRAQKGLEFNIGNHINISNKHSLLDINGDGEITEEEKLTIFLSHIPFVGYLNYAKYSENSTIQESTRLNIFITFLLSILYLSGYSNLANLFGLFYIIFITFIGINLFTRNELIQIKLAELFSAYKIRFYIIVGFKYLKYYFSEEHFKDIYTIIKNENDIIKSNNEKELIELNEKKDLRPAKFLLYIPFINLIFLFFKNTKYTYHKINGIIITILITIGIFTSFYGYTSYNIILLSLFPILFGIGFSKYKLDYKIPFIFDIYIVLSKLFGFSKTIKDKRKEVNEISLKIQEKTV